MKMIKTTIQLAGLFLLTVVTNLCSCGGTFDGLGKNDGCTPETTRCHGDILQICNADNNWELVATCPDFEPGDWACCPIGGEFACAKVEDCQ
jgi:hypothetical protein